MAKQRNISNGTFPLDCWTLASYHSSSGSFWGELIAVITMNGLVIFGNLLVAIAPFLNRRLRNPGHYFIASLAWADFALGVFIVPFAASMQLRGGVWMHGAYGCQLWQTMDIMFCTGSIYSLIAITFDRYVAVTKPLLYKSWMTTKTCALLIMAVWLGALAVAFPSVFLTWSRNADLMRSSCRCTPAAIGAPFILYSSFASFFLPMAIILYFYARIYVTVRKIRLNSNRGVVNVRRRSPPTGMTSLHNTDVQDAFIERSMLTDSNTDLQKKSVYDKRYRKKNSNARQDHIQRDEECSSLLPPNSPHPARRCSEGPVLRIHKGRYHATLPSRNGLKVEPVAKKRSACSIVNDSLDEIEQDEGRNHRNRSITEFVGQRQGKGAGISRILLQAVIGLAPPPAPSPSPSLAWIGSGGELDCDNPAGNQMSNNEKSQDKDRKGSKQDKVPNDAWLQFALPSQLVSAWSQRMLALQRYRRKLSLELRALKTVVMVTGCFFVCWTGFCVVYTMQAFPSCHSTNWHPWSTMPTPMDSCVPDWLFNTFVWLGYANSAANPIIYGAMNAQFRRTFRRFVGKVRVARFV